MRGPKISPGPFEILCADLRRNFTVPLDRFPITPAHCPPLLALARQAQAARDAVVEAAHDHSQVGKLFVVQLELELAHALLERKDLVLGKDLVGGAAGEAEM